MEKNRSCWIIDHPSNHSKQFSALSRLMFKLLKLQLPGDFCRGSLSPTAVATHMRLVRDKKCFVYFFIPQGSETWTSISTKISKMMFHDFPFGIRIKTWLLMLNYLQTEIQCFQTQYLQFDGTASHALEWSFRTPWHIGAGSVFEM